MNLEQKETESERRKKASIDYVVEESQPEQRDARSLDAAPCCQSRRETCARRKANFGVPQKRPRTRAASSLCISMRQMGWARKKCPSTHGILGRNQREAPTPVSSHFGSLHCVAYRYLSVTIEIEGLICVRKKNIAQSSTKRTDFARAKSVERADFALVNHYTTLTKI